MTWSDIYHAAQAEYENKASCEREAKMAFHQARSSFKTLSSEAITPTMLSAMGRMVDYMFKELNVINNKYKLYQSAMHKCKDKLIKLKAKQGECYE